jgi:hypothetical protein
VASFGPNFVTPHLNWLRRAADRTVASEVDSIHLNASGSDIYLAGAQFNATSGHEDGLVGALHADTGATDLYLRTFAFATRTHANAVGVDSTGKADVGLLYTGNGRLSAGFYQVQTDGTLTGGVLRFFQALGGATAGGFTGVSVDASDNFYLTGNIHSDAGRLTDSIEDAVGADDTTQLYAGGGAWIWGFNNGMMGPPLNTISSDNVLDSSDGQYDALTIDDGSGMPGTHGVEFFGITSAGNMAQPDSGDAGLGGSGDDFFTGIARDTRITQANTYYMAGYTNSIDFGVTTGETTYPGGPQAGWLASVHLG